MAFGFRFLSGRRVLFAVHRVLVFTCVFLYYYLIILFIVVVCTCVIRINRTILLIIIILVARYRVLARAEDLQYYIIRLFDTSE